MKKFLPWFASGVVIGGVGIMALANHVAKNLFKNVK